MAGYFGTEAQQRLQALAEASADFIDATPGACQSGRTMGCDDPDRLGWPQIDAFLDRDGVCGFRLIPATKVAELKSHLLARDYRLDSWDVFLADRAAALTASEAVVARGLPDGLRVMAAPTEPENDYVRRIQNLMAAAGVVPFSGSMLTGAARGMTTVVGDDKGNPVATAHCYLPHNVHSAYASYAWGGLVAVADAWRGKGLGNYVNARMTVSACRDLGATHLYELVSTTNIASRRMVEASGLRLEPSLFCGIAARNDSPRFTR